jgi:guanylate kinase
MTREEFSAQLPALVSNYQPAQDVLDQVKGLEVLMVVGPSGVGKTTLIQGSGLAYVPSDTTRAARPGEIEAQDFYFRSDYDQIVQEIQSGRFVQVAVDSGGDLKATKASSYPQSGVVVMAVVADALPIFRKLGFKRTVTAFITPPTYDEWMRRLLIHQLSADEFGKRIEEAQRSISTSLSDPEMHFIMNDNLELAENQLIGLLAGNIDQDREQRAKQAAEGLLSRVSEAKS